MVKRFKTGWRVYDDKGKSYSKKPLSKKTATAQLRALYANVPEARTFKGSGYCCMDKDMYLDGDGFFSDFFNKVKDVAKGVISRVKGVSKGIRKELQPKARSLMDTYGDYIITNIFIRRKPIFDVLDKVLNILSLGKLAEAKAKYNYDKLFHLSMVFAVRPPDRPSGSGGAAYIKVEKNEVPDFEVYNYKQVISQPYMQFGVPCCITLREAIENAHKLMGPNFYTYDAFTNNCQVFIASILKANGLLTQNLNDFIMQDTEGILKQLPSYIQPLARKITDIGGLANVALEGEGKGSIMMSAKSFIAEHKKLVKLLNDTANKLSREAKDQSSEAKARTGVNVGGRRPPGDEPPMEKYDYQDNADDEEDDELLDENDELPEEILHIMDLFEGEEYGPQIDEILDTYSLEHLHAIRDFLDRHAHFNLEVPIIVRGHYQHDVPLVDVVHRAITMIEPPVERPSGDEPDEMQGGRNAPRSEGRRMTADEAHELIARARELSLTISRLTGHITGTQMVITFADPQHRAQLTEQLNALMEERNAANAELNEIRPLLDMAHAIVNMHVDNTPMKGGSSSWKKTLARFVGYFGIPMATGLTSGLYAESPLLGILSGATLTAIAGLIEMAYDKLREGLITEPQAENIIERLRSIQEELDDNKETMREGDYLERMNELMRLFNRVNLGEEVELPTWAGAPTAAAPAPAPATIATRPATDETAIQMYENPMYRGIENALNRPSGSGKAKKWVQKVVEDMKKGAFTKQALRHGKTPEQFAKMVLEHPENFTLTTRRRAQFLENLSKRPLKGRGDSEDELAEIFAHSATISRPEVKESGRESRMAKPIIETKTTAPPESGKKRKAERPTMTIKEESESESESESEDEKEKQPRKRAKKEEPVKGKGSADRFARQLAEAGIAPATYLKQARAAANKAGYDGRALEFAKDGTHKLMIYDDHGKAAKFGRVGYGDFIIWSAKEKAGEVAKGHAMKKRETFHKSHSKIKGDWMHDKFSPNMLALKILW